MQFILETGFDGVKIDNCGDDQAYPAPSRPCAALTRGGTQGLGFAARQRYLNASGRALVIENSNQASPSPSP